MGSIPGTLPPDSLDAPATTRALPAGTVIADRYRVEELLGEGGMGAVYRAEHVHMRKHVALKVLHPSMSATEEIVARFEREAVAAGNIDHPNIAAATDFGKLADGSFFLVLEYIDGKSLRALLDAERRLGPQRALLIVQQVASALVAAHGKGVVHRDLKPDNIMLVARPEGDDLVKVLDFGIAKVDLDAVSTSPTAPGGPGSSQPLTRMGAVFGTPDYMSPEQAVGQEVDGRADLYALGVMLYEMLAGERPYRGGTVTVLRQHVLHEIPDLPPDVLGNVDGRVGPLVRDLLAKDPASRVPSADALIERVNQILADPTPPVSVVAPPTPPTTPIGVLPTRVAAQGIAVAAPTAIALEGSPAVPAVVLSGGEREKAAQSARALPPRTLALVGGGSLLVGLLLVGAWVALHAGPSKTAAAGPGASASDAPHVDVAPTLPPPPAAAEAKVPARSSAAVIPPPPEEEPSRTEGPGTASTPSDRPASTSGSSRGKGRPKEGRKTGPGGIYIPPPKDWF